MHQYATLEDTVYFGFGSNLTSGTAGDGATPLFDVRLAGAASTAAPVLSGTPTLLTHANYTDGCYEVAVAATAVNGFAAGNTYLVYATLTIDSVTPAACVGSFKLAPVVANTTQWLGTACATPTVAGVPEVDTTHVAGTAQTAKDIGAAVPAAAPGASGGLLISGSNTGTTTLGALSVTGAMTVSGGTTLTSSTGNGLTCSSSGGNGNGLAVAGNGSGSGINAFGGATGHGIYGIGGTTSGDGIHAHGTAAGDGIHAESHGTNQHGIHATGVGTGSGIYAQAGTTGNGMTLVGGGTSGDGLNASVTSGIEINADITGNITGNLSGSVGSVTGLTASNVADIKAKTDSLTFTKANELDANIQSINNVTINGDGSATPMGV